MRLDLSIIRMAQRSPLLKLRICQIALSMLCGAVGAIAVVVVGGGAGVAVAAASGSGWLVGMTLLSRRVATLKTTEEIESLRQAKPPVYRFEALLQRSRWLYDATESVRLDDQTIEDLDLSELHLAANRTLTIPGETELLSFLTDVPIDRDTVTARRRGIDRIRATPSPEDADAIRRVLHRVGRETSADPTAILFDTIPPEDPRVPFYLVLSFVTIGLTIASIAGALWAVIPMVLMMFLNLVVYSRSATAFSDLLPRLSTLIRLLEAADRLSSMPLASSADGWCRSRSVPGLRRVVRNAWFLTVRPGEINDVVATVLLYPKVFLLLDALVYRRLLRLVADHQKHLRSAFHVVGQLDAMLALSEYLDTLPWTCHARVSGMSGVSARGIYHPLLADPVANDIDLAPPGLVLTGANMSGKSTFLRTLGINIVLARTIGIGTAGEFSCAPLRVVTLIRKRDSIASDTSLYLYEARRIFAAISEIEGGEPLFVAVDEFFSGTNSRERIAASIAVLSWLATHRCVVAAATHDEEVAEGLAGTYGLVHFSDRVDDGSVRFDYRLKTGIVKSTNAISLLRAIGYPREIVSLAASLADASSRPTRP